MEKTFKAEQKFILESPRKIRLVVGLIKKMKPVDAVEKLPFVQKRAALDVQKVIKSAIANARVQGASDMDLVFKEIQVGEGPRLKRGIAVSRGQWHPIKRRMAHIKVILTVKAAPKKEAKVEKIEEVKPEVKAQKKVTKKNVAKS